MPFDFKNAFGSGDITCVAIFPDAMFILDEIANFAVSTHFDKPQVRRLGNALPVGIATGSGTVAGTLVAKQMTRGALWKLRRYAGTIRIADEDPLTGTDPVANTGVTRTSSQVDSLAASILPQQLPSFHLMFVHANQSGEMALARIYNVNPTDYNVRKGVTQRQTEETIRFKALFYEQLRLRRSLDTKQMQDLIGQQRGLFNDPREPALVEQLSQIEGVDSIGDYVVESTEESIERFQNNEPSTIGIANQGTVVVADPEDQYDLNVDETASSSAEEEEEQTETEIRRYPVDVEAVRLGSGGIGTATLKGQLVHIPDDGRLFFIEEGDPEIAVASDGDTVEDFTINSIDALEPARETITHIRGTQTYTVPDEAVELGAVHSSGQVEEIPLLIGSRPNPEFTGLPWKDAASGDETSLRQVVSAYRELSLQVTSDGGVAIGGSLLRSGPMEASIDPPVGTYRNTTSHYKPSLILSKDAGGAYVLNSSHLVGLDDSDTGTYLDGSALEEGPFSNALEGKDLVLSEAKTISRDAKSIGANLHMDDGNTHFLRESLSGFDHRQIGEEFDPGPIQMSEPAVPSGFTMYIDRAEMDDTKSVGFREVVVKIDVDGETITRRFEQGQGARKRIRVGGHIYLGVGIGQSDGQEVFYKPSLLYDLRDPGLYTYQGSENASVQYGPRDEEDPEYNMRHNLATGEIESGHYQGRSLMEWLAFSSLDSLPQAGGSLPLPGPADLHLPSKESPNYN